MGTYGRVSQGLPQPPFLLSLVDFPALLLEISFWRGEHLNQRACTWKEKKHQAMLKYLILDTEDNVFVGRMEWMEGVR